eukprot:4557357-Pleurochrysis_carterae.AAC.1
MPVRSAKTSMQSATIYGLNLAPPWLDALRDADARRPLCRRHRNCHRYEHACPSIASMSTDTSLPQIRPVPTPPAPPS